MVFPLSLVSANYDLMHMETDDHLPLNFNILVTKDMNSHMINYSWKYRCRQLSSSYIHCKMSGIRVSNDLFLSENER